MHLRRALLLFAIVLGLAAVAASVSRPRDDESGRDQSATQAPAPTQDQAPPTVAPGSAPAERPLEATVFRAGREDARRVPAGLSTTVLVEVEEAGEVEIPDLGLSSPAEPLTPARFEIFTSEPASHEVVFTPAAGDESRPAGTLTVEAAEG